MTKSKTEINENKNKGTLDIAGKVKSNSTDKFKILNEFLDLHQVDLNIWEVDHYLINAWDVTMKMRQSDSDQAESYTNYQIKVWLKKKIITLEESFKDIIKNIPTFEYSSKIPKFKPGNGIALELSTFDAHFQKLAWEQETGYRNYDLDIASKDYTYVNDQLLSWALPYAPEQIFYVIGQDLYHTDNMAGHTTNGDHTLDVDGRITKVHRKIFEITIQNILKARAVAPVRVIWSPGNHDYLASYMLCFAIEQYFREDQYVTVDIGYNPKKAILWGNLLVGFTHRIVGKHNVWSNELAQMFPDLWAKSVFREWHHGDQHKKQDVKAVPTYTSGGVLMRQLTALSPVDKWHAENVFTDAVPGGEAFLWSKTQGVFANFIAWTGQYENNRNKLVI